MLRTTIPRGALRFPLTARPTIRTIPIRSLHQASKPKSTTGFTLPSHNLRSPKKPNSIWQRLRFLHNSRGRRNGKPTSPDPTPNLGSPKGSAAEADPTSLGARMRKLSREYGWSGLGVYLMLSALDFPFCYLLVRTLGTDRIGEWEHIIVSNVKKMIPESVKQTWHDWRVSMKNAEHEHFGNEEISDAVEMAGWGVEEAEQKNKMDASLATQLALAYAIHKSFIFIRVPIAVAVTPKVVKVLRGWGWDIGKRTTKEAKAIRRAHVAASPTKKKRGRKA
ncbi:putative N-terminal acetyltransferase 2 [Lachnellula cervina]|uniref:Putative N-terminal acetyltransferase 2 n=1 Tax=Lachnellula cervina TaxID=1316786 RepID=A0A7D8YH19_9HELO|nr:putative N-terminal acetyltransferase 2 [Lachnellula cervina]